VAAQIAFLTAHSVALHRRVERSVTHSIRLTDPNGYLIELVYELPRALWENDIDAELSHQELTYKAAEFPNELVER
jgi:catechol-2,3-dioxygenase